MIVGARCTNRKCDSAKNKTIFNPTKLTESGLGPWNGPWKCPDCGEEMYTERRDMGKAEGKTTPGKTVRRRVASAPPTAKLRRKKALPKTAKKYSGRKKS